MGSLYREYRPSSRLATYVECFWTGDVYRDFSARILPDGCADILFMTGRGGRVDVQVVGVMTRAHVARLAAGTTILGVRFHPGMAGAYLGCDLWKLNDRYVPLRSVSAAVANDLSQGIFRRSSAEAKMAALESRLTSLPRVNRVQSAIRELVACRGELPLRDFAAAAGVGVRQLRRACFQQVGVTPKHLARILRFRHAVARLRNGQRNSAEVALDCGYYDQAHMIRDFRRLAGVSPGRYLRERDG